MKHIIIALSVALTVAGLTSITSHKDSRRILSADELTTVTGGLPGFTDCNTTSCPNAGTCIPTGGGSYSTFYYNNGHTACGFAWFSTCKSKGTADCLAKDHGNGTCTAPYGSQYISSTAAYCL